MATGLSQLRRHVLTEEGSIFLGISTSRIHSQLSTQSMTDDQVTKKRKVDVIDVLDSDVRISGSM